MAFPEMICSVSYEGTCFETEPDTQFTFSCDRALSFEKSPRKTLQGGHFSTGKHEMHHHDYLLQNSRVGFLVHFFNLFSHSIALSDMAPRGTPTVSLAQFRYSEP